MPKKGYKQSKEHKEKIKSRMKGRVFTEEWKEKISKAKLGHNYGVFHKGHKINVGRIQSKREKEKRAFSMIGNKNGFVVGMIPWNKGKIGFLSDEIRNKISIARKNTKQSIKTRNKISKSLRGEKSSFWKGGITSVNSKIRSSLKYRLWREKIFKRDNWTCVLCKKRCCELNADHIKPFSLFPELRFAIDNGRTLCKECHKKTDTYGGNIRNFKK